MSAGPDIALIKCQVEAQLAEYVTAAAEARAFMSDWRNRNDPAARRVQRFRAAAAKRSAA